MASRDYIRHTVSNVSAASGRLGDEYFDPGTNVLTKRVAINGSVVTDAQVPIVASGNLRLASTTGVSTLTTNNRTTPLAFGTDGYEWMRVDTNGNFGIGVTNPSGKLDVNQQSSSSIGIRASQPIDTVASAPTVRAVGYSPSFELMNRDSTQNWYFGINDNDSKKLYIGRGYGANQGVSPAMVIDITDNIGMGVSSVAAGNKLQVNGVIADRYGSVRDLPINTQGGAYVLTALDNGNVVSISTGGVTVNASVFSAGNNTTIYNNSAANQTITQGASVTMYLAGTATTGNRTLAQRGIATLLCIVGGATPTFVISGSGLT